MKQDNMQEADAFSLTEKSTSADAVSDGATRSFGTIPGALYEEESLRTANSKTWRMNNGTAKRIVSFDVEQTAVKSSGQKTARGKVTANASALSVTVYSKTHTGAEWMTVESQYIRVSQKPLNTAYKTVIAIDKSKLRIYGKKASKARLTLLGSSVLGSGTFKISGKMYDTAINLYLDITSSFNDSGDVLELEMAPYDGDFDCQYSLTGINAPVLELEYIVNEEIKPCRRQVALAGNAVGTLDALTGELSCEIPVASGEGLSVNAGVSLIHKNSGDMLNCGDNFRLNLHEKLEKVSNDAYDSNYVYTDSYGEKFGFKENFYYIDRNRNKVNVTKDNVIVDFDGSLRYNDNKVYKEELSSTGWKAVTRLDGVKNADILEQRQDEYKQLEEQVRAYEDALKEYVAIDTETGDTVRDGTEEVTLVDLSTDSFNKIIAKSASATVMPITRSEMLQYKNLLSEVDMFTNTGYNTENILPQKTDVKKQLLAIESAYYEINETLKNIVSGNMITAGIFGGSLENFTEILARLVNNTPVPKDLIDDSFADNAGYVGYSLGDSPSDTAKAAQPKLGGYSVKAQLRQRNLYLEQLMQQRGLSDKHYDILLAQCESIKGRKEQYIRQLQQYYKEYVNKKADFELMEKYALVSYLTDGNIIKGFNSEGELVAIGDSYNNAVVIERDDKNRIARIYDDKSSEIIFAYNGSGVLEAITDACGRTTKFEYSEKGGGILPFEITYHDGGAFTLKYNDDLSLSGIESSDRNIAWLAYDRKRVSTVLYHGLSDEISHGVSDNNSASFIKVLMIKYGDKETTVTETTDSNVNYYYKFNDDGNLAAYYVKKAGVVVQAEMYDYKKYEHDNTAYAKRDSLYKTTLTVPFVPGATENITLNGFNDPTLKVVSGIEVAPGVTRDERTEYEYDDRQRVISERTRVDTKQGDTVASTYTAVKKYRYNGRGKVVYSESYIEGEELTEGKTVEETFYDDKGHVIKSYAYNSLDSASKFYSQREVAENGRLTSDIDETGENKTVYEYKAGTDGVITKVLPNGGKVGYGYDDCGNVTAITQSTEDGEENGVCRGYTCGLLTKATGGGNTVNYVYDAARRLKRVYLNNDENAYVEYTYPGSSSSKNVKTKFIERRVSAALDSETVTDNFEIEKNAGGDVVKMLYNDVQQISAEYDAKHNLTTLTDAVSGTTLTNTYDSFDRKLTSVQNGRDGAELVKEEYEYNSDGTTRSKTITTGGIARTYDFEYGSNAAKTLKSVTVEGVSIMPRKDCAGRNTGKKIIVGGEEVAEEYIAYRKAGDHATNMPSVMRFVNRTPIPSNLEVNASSDTDTGSVVDRAQSENTASAIEKSDPSESFNIVSKISVTVTNKIEKSYYMHNDYIKYAYDACGNISEIRENGTLAAKYTYDKLNRLVREDNKQLGKTSLFTYDNNGNILSKREFAFTLKETALLDEAVEAKYAHYNYSGDKLVLCGKERFKYDALGNPLIYRNKKCLWEKGRNLVNYNGVEFAYNGRGQRIGKGNVNYTYDGSGNIVKQSDGENTLEYIYDHSGITGVKRGEETYIYRRNAQGDIIALLDSNGALVVKYVYDAWGSHKVTSPDGSVISDQTHIGNLNPFRYRGYYYDIETGLYYLKTRYYDPEVGRFITIDDISYLDPETINGLNLYAYCGNNPVMNVDENGTKWWEFWKWDWKKIGQGIAAVIGVTALVIATVFTAGAVGGIAGVIMMTAAIGIAFGAAIGGVSAVINGTNIAAGILGGAIKGGSIGITVGLGIVTGTGAFTLGGALLALGGTIILNFVAGTAKYLIENIMNGKSLNVKDVFASGGLQAASGLFAFGAGAIIGISGYYNGLKVTKMFSPQWLGNFAASQLIKAIFYYPLSIIFGYLQKALFSGGN